MEKKNATLDYLTPNITELAPGRGPAAGPSRESSPAQSSGVEARRMLLMCLVTPALLWWLLFLGVHRHWYKLETCFTLFVFSVTLVFGVMACLNLKRLSRLDAQRALVQEQLRHAKDAAEAANRFKSMFFANISHEIRTPLTAINGFAELLLNPERSEAQRLQDARVIRRNGEHLLSLINDILDLSKIEAGKMSVDPVLCCPAKVVGEVCSMLRVRAADKGITLDVVFEGPIPKKIRTDPTRLRQVLINLVANAVKFTKEGGVKLTVSIKPSIQVEQPQLEVKITDTGIGISPEQQASLFQPFVQGDLSITRHYGGSGLGLAISRHFARVLGGDIAVTSEPGCGSTFTVTVGTDSLMSAAMHEDAQEAMDAQDTFTGRKVRINGSILVAEDGLDNQALIAAKLTETGVNFEIAPNGQIACEKALAAAKRGSPFNLILMDVQMPVMDGFTAMLQLRSGGYRGPIIALTANAMDRDRSKCLSAGCNDFVTKPIQMDKLFKAIGRYLQVVPVTTEVVSADASTATATATATATRAAQAQKFYQELPEELSQIEQAIERQDREKIKEVAQLMLGKTAAAGLKDLAPLAAKLLAAAQDQASWLVLRQAVKDFARDAQPATRNQAA